MSKGLKPYTGDMSINFLMAIVMAQERLLGISKNYTDIGGSNDSRIAPLNDSRSMTSILNDGLAVANNQDIPSKAKTNSFYQAAMYLNLYYPPLLIVIGFLGNSLSLLVMLQRNNRKFSCCVYLAGLALGDNLFMINALHLWLMTAIFPEQFTHRHCTIVAYSFQVKSKLRFSRSICSFFGG